MDADLGKEHTEEFLEKIIEARKEYEEKPAEVKSFKFIQGIPHNDYWIRVQINDDLKRNYLEKLTESFELSHKMLEDGFLLIYGDKNKIQLLIKKVADRINLRETD